MAGTEKFVDEIMDRLPVNVSFYDADLRMLDLNQAQLAIFPKLSKDEIVGKTMYEFGGKAFNESDRPGIYRRVLETGEQATVRAVAFNGVHLGVNVFRFRPGVLGICSMDVSRWVDDHMETIRELEKKNAQLEQFAYVASHDLQEPLRTLLSFVDLLTEESSVKLSPEAAEYGRYVRRAAERMQTLTRDLLEYSRVGRIEPRAVDCYAVMSTVLADLDSEIAAADASVTISKLPTLLFDPTLLRQLLQNLLGNALKFRAEGRKTLISVEARRLADAWEFSVKDNGIGIEPQFRDRIFRMFQRLHSREKYEGSGIGLSLCQRIVEENGGKLAVTSEPGVGSVFSFTIKDSTHGAKA